MRMSFTIPDDLFRLVSADAKRLNWTEDAVIRDRLRAAFDIGEGSGGIGDLANTLIREGKTNAAVLDIVQREFPLAATSEESIRWYRKKLREAGEAVLTNTEVRSRIGE